MLVFFDTTVLVAASERSHPHHAQAWPTLRRVVSGEDQGFMGAQSIAELLAALTRLPVQPRIQPFEALRMVTENLLPHFEIVPIKRRDYLEALEKVANGGWSGAKIYDALLVGCAAKCGADRVYTFNVQDFRMLAPDHLKEKICTP